MLVIVDLSKWCLFSRAKGHWEGIEYLDLNRDVGLHGANMFQSQCVRLVGKLLSP